MRSITFEEHLRKTASVYSATSTTVSTWKHITFLKTSIYFSELLQVVILCKPDAWWSLFWWLAWWCIEHFSWKTLVFNLRGVVNQPLKTFVMLVILSNFLFCLCLTIHLTVFFQVWIPLYFVAVPCSFHLEVFWFPLVSVAFLNSVK